MRVEHPTYGQGIIISQTGSICTVKFDSGLTKDISRSELMDVILG
jgi:hypothetical protein